MSNFSSKFKQAAALRPMLNIGCLFDIPTGRYYTGARGESILNGGMANFGGFVGMPNMFKTAMAMYQKGVVLARYPSAALAVHDTENTLSVERLYEHLSQFDNIAGHDLVEEERLVFSDATVYVGNEWFEDLKKFSKERRDDTSNRMTTPFVNHRTQEKVKIPSPVMILLDSLSGLNTDAVVNMYEKAEIGEAGLNMVAMKGSSAKSQMIDQMTNVAAPGGLYVTMTGHVGQEYQLDPYKPNPRKLKFLKQGEKIKKIPENFLFLTSNCYQATSLEVLLDDEKKPMFPRDDAEDQKGDTDLQLITVVNLRCKSGPSGLIFKVVVSQSEGVKVGLTEYMHLKENNYFGLSDTNGNSAKGKPNYRVDLCPDISLNRKNIRGKIETSPELQRALAFTSELCQITYIWHHVEEDLLCTPKELYEDLKKIGYDWSILLNTRGYWAFEEDNNPLPFLSTMDLLKMRAGLYHPYWYPKKREEMNLSSCVKIASTIEAEAGQTVNKIMTPAMVSAALDQAKTSSGDKPKARLVASEL